MHDRGGVRGRERVGHLRRQAQRALGRQRPGGHEIGQRPARDELHGDVVEPGVGADLVDGQDVGMVERGRGLRLAQEPARSRGFARLLGAHDLEGSQAAQPRVPGLVDDTHAALAESSSTR